MKQTDIKDGQTILTSHDGGFIRIDTRKEGLAIIQNVGNAREKGHRGASTTPEDELSYDIYYPETGETFTGICGHSHTTTTAQVLSKDEVELYVLERINKNNKKMLSLRRSNQKLTSYFSDNLEKNSVIVQG